MLARYCSPTLGRFLSFDPIGGNRRSSQSWNRYSYALNNPINYTDPEGLIAELFFDLQFVLFDEVTVEGSSYFDVLDFLWLAGGFFSDFAPMGAPEIGPIGDTTAPLFGLVQALNGRNELEMVRFGIDTAIVDTGGVPEFAIFLPTGGALRAGRLLGRGRGLPRLGRIGDAGARGLTRMERFRSLANSGFNVGAKRFGINPHLLNSLRKSGRRHVDPESMIRALQTQPTEGIPSTRVFRDPEVGTRFFVNDDNVVIGVHPASFR